MSDAHRNTNSGTAGILALIVVLPIVYILSMGPVGYAATRFSLFSSYKTPLLTFYGPVIWLHDHTALKRPIERYVEWWSRMAQP